MDFSWIEIYKFNIKSRHSPRIWKRDLSCNIQFNRKKKQRFPVIMKRTGNSLGKEYAAFGCSSRIYSFVNKERKPTCFQGQRQKLTTGGN